jgi:hypothetical protein
MAQLNTRTPARSKPAPSVDQLRFMEKTAAARRRASELAADANRLGLMTLAREWDFIGTCLERAIARQLLTFEPPTLEEPRAASGSGPAGSVREETSGNL